MKKRAIRLLSMLLALLMLTGCSSSILNDPLDRAYRALQRSFISAGRNLVPFDEMEYLRPDMSTISADFDAVNDALESGDIDSVSAALDACYLDYYNFDTMYTLADIRSCQDVYDSYYADEVSWCGENFTAVQQKMEDMFYACAASALAQEHFVPELPGPSGLPTQLTVHPSAWSPLLISSGNRTPGESF